jgi:hypothetical protein
MPALKCILPSLFITNFPQATCFRKLDMLTLNCILAFQFMTKHLPQATFLPKAMWDARKLELN